MRLAMTLVARLAPAAAGVGLLVALATRFAGGPLAIPLGVLATFAAGFIIYVIHRRRDRDVSDRVAMSVDTDAGLGGELRSAHWFATSGTDDEWAAEMNEASNCDGARNTPESSIFRKYSV